MESLSSHLIQYQVSHKDFEELKGKEAQCPNCYHEKDFPHETLVLNKHTQQTLCLYCYR